MHLGRARCASPVLVVVRHSPAGTGLRLGPPAGRLKVEGRRPLARLSGLLRLRSRDEPQLDHHPKCIEGAPVF